jgi:hypothetical protein
MAGEAKTTEFMLGTATVMMGAQADLLDLLPASHSLGLVKNVTLTSEPSYTELTQGVKNTIVYSVMTQNQVRASMEVYEYTAKNIMYALGLDGSGYTAATAAGALSAPALEDAVSIVLGAGQGTPFAVGDWILIDLGPDNIIVRKVASKSTDTLTFVGGLPVGVPSATPVRVSKAIDIGSKENQPFLSCKIVGLTAEGEPITILFPKVRIVNGFNLAFTTDDFGNMPFELTIYDLASTDPFYSTFGSSPGVILAD